MTHVDQATCTAALEREFAALDELASSLAPEEWHRPTALPGWDVHANFAHVIGTEAMLLDEPTPPVDVDVAGLAHVRNDIGGFNEAWVITLAAASPEEMLAAYRPRIERAARRPSEPSAPRSGRPRGSPPPARTPTVGSCASV